MPATLTYPEEIAALERKIRNTERAIASTEESLARQGWPEIAADLEQLNAQLTELEVQHFNLTERVWY